MLFTAHSLPERITETGDPYPDQLRQSADAIAAAADVERYRGRVAVRRQNVRAMARS